jgi:O-antigen ligase
LELYEVGTAILIATLFLVIASTTSLRVSVGFLLLLAPYHVVEVMTITNTVAMTYAVTVGVLLSGRTLRVPMLGSMLIVILGYLISISQVHPSLYRLHGIWLITLVAGFAMFALAYNFARNEQDPRTVPRVLIFTNVLVVGYCLIQVFLGPGESATLFGIDSLSIESNRGAGDPRLGGPFGGAPGIVAEYLALMTIFVVYEAMNSSRRWRTCLFALTGVNVALVVATGNRGGFATLVVGFIGFLYIFRRTLGAYRVTQLSALATCLFLLGSVIVTELTGFNVMFDRLSGVTELEGGIPATRQYVWPQAWQRFTEVPWFGQGPIWKLPNEEHGVYYPGHVFFSYPHSLYLYLLVTTGVVGMTAFAVFFFSLAARYLRAARDDRHESEYVIGLVRLAPLLLLVFAVDQIRIEFLRPVFSDYQQFVFGLFGALLGLGDRSSFGARGRTA